MELVVDDGILLFEDGFLERRVLCNKSRLPFRVVDLFCEASESGVDGGGLRSLELLVRASCDPLVVQFLFECLVCFTLDCAVFLELLHIMDQAFWDVRWNHSRSKPFYGGARGARVIGIVSGVVGRGCSTVLVRIRVRVMGRRLGGVDQRVIRSGGWRRRSVGGGWVSRLWGRGIRGVGGEDDGWSIIMDCRVTSVA